MGKVKLRGKDKFIFFLGLTAAFAGLGLTSVFFFKWWANDSLTAMQAFKAYWYWPVAGFFCIKFIAVFCANYFKMKAERLKR